jgi:hypothetical protein
VADPIATLVASGRQLDADLLTDPDVDLADLAGKASSK